MNWLKIAEILNRKNGMFGFHCEVNNTSYRFNSEVLRDVLVSKLSSVYSREEIVGANYYSQRLWSKWDRWEKFNLFVSFGKYRSIRKNLTKLNRVL